MLQVRSVSNGRTARFMIACAIFLFAIMPSAGLAQNSGLVGDELFFPNAAFRIPFSVPTGAQVYKAKLFVSRDQGNSWKWAQDANPDAREFTYVSTDGDGSYWFAVQTITQTGGAIPQTITGNNNGQVLRVVVDARPPTVNITKLLHGQDGSARIEWTVYDEHLRTETLTLEYRVPPGNQWFPVPIENKQTSGVQVWSAGLQQVEVRLSVQDKAGNIGKATALTSPPTVTPPPGSGSVPSRSSTQPDTDIKYVNNPKIRLRYSLNDVGKSGVAQVEVWKKPMPGTWDPQPLVKKDFSGDHRNPEPVEIDLGNEDGLYGLTLVAKSGVQVSLPAPAGNDPPQMVVRLLRTSPTVTINNVDVGKGASTGRVTITWQASQKDNLMSRQCISIYYAVPTGDGSQPKWRLINPNKLDNIGQFVWTVPQDYGESRISFRVDAEDWAHNVGSGTRENVVLDLNAPTGRLQGIDQSP